MPNPGRISLSDMKSLNAGALLSVKGREGMAFAPNCPVFAGSKLQDKSFCSSLSLAAGRLVWFARRRDGSSISIVGTA